MKKFVITILCFLGVPVLLLLGLYLWTDPFRCVHPFDINNTDATNREYLSTELYLHNRDSIHYDSFVFASSRGCGINTYTWKMYLDTTAQPFLFQAWSETVTGEYLKMKYLDETGVEIKNALILLDIPGAFKEKQLSHDALDMKHYLFTDGNRFTYNTWQFFNYLQKPSGWVKAFKNRNTRMVYGADPITNDWDRENKNHYGILPEPDSLKNCTKATIQTLMAEIEGKTDEDAEVSPMLVTNEMEYILSEMKRFLDTHHTDFKLILTPAICYNHPTINPTDLEILQEIFGVDRVYNYTGPNEYTRNVNNYMDPGHFGEYVGYKILSEIYNWK